MADILSQDEIDALLNAVGDGDDDEMVSDDVISDQSSSAMSTIEESAPEKTISKYDFRRPEVISKDQVRTLQMIHKAFSRTLTNAFSSYLRSNIEVNLMAVDQLTYGEFNMSLSNPTCINTFSMSPLEGLAVFEINPLIVFVMIERLLGGTGKTPTEIRALTDIETAIFEKVINMSLKALQDSWEHVQPLKLDLKDSEANPQFIQIVAPGETVILITLEVKMGETSGIISVCYPFILLEPLVSKLSAQQWISATKKSDQNYVAHITENLHTARLDVVAQLGKVRLTVRDIINLRKGDAIALTNKAKDPIVVRIKRQNKFYALPGIIGRYKVVRLLNVIGEDEDV